MITHRPPDRRSQYCPRIRRHRPLYALVGSVYDIGERIRRAEVRALLEAAPDAMVVVDREGKIVLINAQEKLFGYKRDELWGKTIEILVPERFRGRHSGTGELFPTTEDARNGRGPELYGLRKMALKSRSKSALALSKPRKGRWTSAIRDITDRRRLEAALVRVKSASLRPSSSPVSAIGRLISPPIDWCGPGECFVSSASRTSLCQRLRAGSLRYCRTTWNE